MTRIALIHALAHSVAPIREAFERDWPEAQRMNLLDDSLSADLAASGGVLDAAMHQRFIALADYAVGTGAQGILFTCSAFGPCIEAVARRHAALPVLKPNEAMVDDAAALAAQRGCRIGLLASFRPTLQSMPPEFPADVEIVPACGSPESILRRLNRSLHKVIEPGLFVTAMAVMFDPRQHAIEIACAGHPPGLLKMAGGEVIELGIDSGLALGPESEPDIGVLHRVLAAGEVLMCTTDGVEEAQNPAGEELGRDRVLEVLRAASGAADAARRLQATIIGHASSARQHDDLTVVTIERCR